MAKRQNCAYAGEDYRATKKHATRTEKAAEVNGERSDKHHGCVEGGIDPGCFVDAKVERAPEIC
jgi:hypothetical protein